MAFNISLPVPHYNFLIVVVSTAVLLWLMRAIARLLRVVAIRNSILNDSMVLVRGLGHNLISFEGAPPSHISSLIRTRPAKPPSQMNVMYLPYIVKSTEMLLQKGSGPLLDIKLWSAGESFVMILSCFKLNFFKQRFHSLRETFQFVLKAIRENHEKDCLDPQYVRRNEFTEMLVRYGICQFISPVCVLNGGHNHVQVPLLTVDGTSRRITNDDAFHALLFIPLPHTYHTYTNDLSSPSTTNTNTTTANSLQLLSDMKNNNYNNNNNVQMSPNRQSVSAPESRNSSVHEHDSLMPKNDHIESNNTNSYPTTNTTTTTTTTTNSLENRHVKPSTTLKARITAAISPGRSTTTNPTTTAAAAADHSHTRPTSGSKVRTATDVSTSDPTNNTIINNNLNQSFSTTDKNRLSRMHNDTPKPDVYTLELFLHIIGTENNNSNNLNSASSEDRNNSNGNGNSNNSPSNSPRGRGKNRGGDKNKNKDNSTSSSGSGNQQNKEDRSLSNSTPPVFTIVEQVISTNNGQLYSINEIYGMKHKDATNATNENTENPSTNEVNSDHLIGPSTAYLQANLTDEDGGVSARGSPNANNTLTSHKGNTVIPTKPLPSPTSDIENNDDDDNECVVCLTEPKSVLLVQCRHLCVCTTCLTHIDKCPVCRTAFDEYIIVRPYSAVLHAPVYTIET